MPTSANNKQLNSLMVLGHSKFAMEKGSALKLLANDDHKHHKIINWYSNCEDESRNIDGFIERKSIDQVETITNNNNCYENID